MAIYEKAGHGGCTILLTNNTEHDTTMPYDEFKWRIDEDKLDDDLLKIIKKT